MRKTNLFYLEGNDSNFLTFSNYGEYLTGVCLSTNHKIWMSSFLCLNLPFTKENETEINISSSSQNYDGGIGEFNDITFLPRKHTVQNFKKFLMCYYENKLAYLKDMVEQNNEKAENLNVNNNLLNYLLDAIQLFFNLETPIESNIEYYGDIIEHDYNGTYNDSMCIVDFYRNKKISISYNESDLKCYDNINPLHNWEDELWSTDNLEENIINYHEICDINNDIKKYNINPIINFNETTERKEENKISFNCIIPLFDIIDADYNENSDNIDENTIESDIYKNIPYGIWFTSENTEDGTLHNIELYKQNDNISQSWSLVICSKFAPYPYGIKINDESDDLLKTIEKYTYAELLVKNSQLLENYNNLSIQYNELNSKINELTRDINNLKQLNNNGLDIYDIYNIGLTNIRNDLQKDINDLKNEFTNFVNQMKWKSINKSN